MFKRLQIPTLNLGLFIIYALAVWCITHLYQLPQISWDSNYYIQMAFLNDFALRPSGYPVFLNFLYKFSQTLGFIVLVQAMLHYCAITVFLYALHKVFRFNNLMYVLLGLMLLLEPVALYHVNSILSDQLFASCTIMALATLILFLQGRKWWLIVHIALVFICIEIRHIGLFYPFFTIAMIVVFTKGWQQKVITSVSILVLFFVLQKWHTHENLKKYGSGVFSPFSGWTHANNALYSLPYADVKAEDIKDDEVRAFQQFVEHCYDSTGYRDEQVGSGYLWVDKSPLNIKRARIIDSLRNHMDDNTAWYTSWYTLAPEYGHYGTYMQMHYPGAYIKGYILPNFKTLISPHIGEMADYYVTPIHDETMLSSYHHQPEDFDNARQLYKDYLNTWIELAYKVLLLLFVASGIGLLLRYKNFDQHQQAIVFALLAFTALFYGLTLYSSWFMYRYLLPVYTVMISAIVILVANVLHKMKKV